MSFSYSSTSNSRPVYRPGMRRVISSPTSCVKTITGNIRINLYAFFIQIHQIDHISEDVSICEPFHLQNYNRCEKNLALEQKINAFSRTAYWWLSVHINYTSCMVVKLNFI